MSQEKHSPNKGLTPPAETPAQRVNVGLKGQKGADLDKARQGRMDWLTIKGDRPAARIQKAFLAVVRTGKPYTEWEAENIQAAWDAVKEERKKLGLNPDVPRTLVEQADSLAAGHVDWSRKFALNCEDLVFDREIQP